MLKIEWFSYNRVADLAPWNQEQLCDLEVSVFNLVYGALAVKTFVFVLRVVLDFIAEPVCNHYKAELKAFTKVHEHIAFQAGPVWLPLLVDRLYDLFELFVWVSDDLGFPVEAGELIHFIFL